MPGTVCKLPIMKSGLIPLLSVFLAMTAFADEGMWLFNQPPRALLRERYQFDVTDEWLEHLQKSSVRFNVGGSGSFVSEDGLIITNHHVGADALQKLSGEERNYVRDGFRAMTPAEEMKCLDLELNVLESIRDVTARVNAAVPRDVEPAAAFAARRRVFAEIEKESLDAPGCDQMWSRSGRAERFIFTGSSDTPMCGWCLRRNSRPPFMAAIRIISSIRATFDICLFRVYENGHPAKVKDFLRFSLEVRVTANSCLFPGIPAIRTGCLRWRSWNPCATTGCLSGSVC